MRKKRHQLIRNRMKKSGKILGTFTAKQLTDALNGYDSSLGNGQKTRITANVNRVANFLRQEKAILFISRHPNHISAI